MKSTFYLICVLLFILISWKPAYASDQAKKEKDRRQLREIIDNLYKKRLTSLTEYNAFVHKNSFIRSKLEAGLKISKKVSQSIVEASDSCNEYQNLDQLHGCLKKLNNLTFSLSTGIAQVQTQVDFFSSPDKNLLPEYKDYLDLLKTWLLYANSLKIKIDSETEKVNLDKSELTGLQASKGIDQIRDSVRSDPCSAINHKISNQLFVMESQLTFTYLNKMVPAFLFQFNRLSKFVGYIKGSESTCQNLNKKSLANLYLAYDSWEKKYRTIDKVSYVAKVCNEIQASQPEKYSGISEYCKQRLTTDNFLNTIWQISRKRFK